MRDIKFRAWNESGERSYMLGPYDLSDAIFNYKEIRSLLLMQYTGLKDKNGKEIYEGDIITCENYTMYGGKYKVCWRQDLMAFMFDLELVSPDYLHHAEGIEVIGNIYENSELLK